MNLIWLIIMCSSIVAMLFINPDGALSAMTMGANKAVTLALTLLAGYSLWLGFFKLLSYTGIEKKLAKALNKPIGFLFPNSSPQTRSYLSMNISANLLGLGNAATPMGINAVNSMYAGSEKATENMIMLLVLSSTSLQIIPSTVISMRINHNSLSPTAFLPACLIATVISTILGVILVKFTKPKA